MCRISFFIMLLVTGLSVRGYSQQELPYDWNRIVKDTKTVFLSAEKRGIESTEGRVYYVATDGQSVKAYDGVRLSWTAEVLASCGKPAVGLPEIRCIRIEKDSLFVVFGKHSFASINRSDGRVEYQGAD